MGIIQRQGIKTTVVNMAGSIIGGISVFFIYSSNDEIYGYAHWLYSAATLLLPIASLGVLSLILKFYPLYSESDNKKYNGFLTLIAAMLVVIFGVFLLFWEMLKPHFYKLLAGKNMDISLFESYEKYVLILLFLFIIIRFMSNQSANKFRVVVPTIIREFGYKVFLPILILVYAYFGWNIDQFSWGIILFFVFVTLLLIVYLKSLNGLNFGKIKRPKSDFSYKELFSFSAFGALNQLSNGLAMRIDSVMIPLIMGATEFNSFYIKAYFVANFIEMPTRSINQIAGPIISKAWNNNDKKEIDTIYKKASSSLFVTGVFIFILIWFCLGDLVNISSDPESFPYVRTIFLLIGLAKLVDMLTSVNSHIIGFSKYYKYNLLFLLILGLANLIMNYIFIRMHGIVGAAIATALSLFLYNLLKLVFIWLRMGMQPFTISNIKTLVLGLGFVGLFYLLPLDFAPIINIIIKGILVSIIYLPLAYYWRISDELNAAMIKTIEKIKSLL